MSKQMLINMIDVEESRVAIVNDGVLEDLYIESAGREQVKGNIYKGVVASIAKSLQACFVDFGGSRAGFLSIDEIDPRFYRPLDPNKPLGQGGERPPIQEVIRLKQELLVQVVKEELGSKGASLTTYISLPGRYMVLMPGSEEVGISRKIEDESARKRLREIVGSFNVPEGIGVIARTAATDKTKTDLVKDFNYLRRLWAAIEEATAHCKAPALIYQERDIVTRAIRDHFTSDIAAIVVDNKEVFDRALEFLKTFLPRHQRALQLYEGKKPLFSSFDIENQIETIYQHQVRLPSGGAIVIDPTEALVAIDVNSAKATQERTAEETALRTNLEAAEEAARQLRLRDLGGIIVVDFIDMRDSKHKRQLERALKNALKHDKARINVGSVSKLGLVELSRQRLKPAIMDRNYLICPQCNGVGMVKSTEAKALILLRKLQSAAADGHLYMVRAHLPIDVYTYLLNKKRDELARMELECGVRFEFTLKTGFDEQVFNPDCLELFTRIPEESAFVARRTAAVKDSAVMAGLAQEAVGRDRIRTEDGLPDTSDLPDFDLPEGEGAAPAAEPGPVTPALRSERRPRPEGHQAGRRRERDRFRERGRGPERHEPHAAPRPAAGRTQAQRPTGAQQTDVQTAPPPATAQVAAQAQQVPQRQPSGPRPPGQPQGQGAPAEPGRRRRRRGRGRGRGGQRFEPGMQTTPDAAAQALAGQQSAGWPLTGEPPVALPSTEPRSPQHDAGSESHAPESGGGFEPRPLFAGGGAEPPPSHAAPHEGPSVTDSPAGPAMEPPRAEFFPSESAGRETEPPDAQPYHPDAGEAGPGQPAAEQGQEATPAGAEGGPPRFRRRRRGRGRRRTASHDGAPTSPGSGSVPPG
ncbi:MAG: Rne/Rng family ribonuclease [Candidatus Riflebacteria bacterium]|nr:Rne/Rng family ribonuclease [Candidatus Riflebacteria bacterium]